jgi:hypothetical protein
MMRALIMMSRANLAAKRRTASPSRRGGFGVGAVIRAKL